MSTYFLTKYCVLCICGPQIFGFPPQDTARLYNIFNGLSPTVSCLNHILGFSPEGVSIATCFTHLHVLFMPYNRESHFGCCPILLSSPSNTKHGVDLTMSSRHTSNTNTVSIYHGQTPNTVPTSTMHSHPTRRDVTVHMKCNHAISCYVMLHATFINFDVMLHATFINFG